MLAGVCVTAAGFQQQYRTARRKGEGKRELLVPLWKSSARICIRDSKQELHYPVEHNLHLAMKPGLSKVHSHTKG